jgi:hypothetical protein
MAPVVAEVEHVAELFAGIQLARDLERGVILPDQIRRIVVAREADAPPAGKLEFVQVREISAGKGSIDRLGELLERVARTDDENAARRRVALYAAAPQ